MKEEVRVLASTIDTWEPLDKRPDRNGWYEICVEITDVYTKEKLKVVTLGLYRDGMWGGEYRGKISAWTYPLRLKDDKLPNGKLKELGDMGAVTRFAQKLLEYESAELTDSFECLITAKSAKKYASVIERYRFAGRMMSSDNVQMLSFGLASQEDIVNTITARVLCRHGVRAENTDAVRKKIHGYIKHFIAVKRMIGTGDISRIKDLEANTRQKIIAAVRDGND